MRSRLGVAGSCAGSEAVAGTFTPGSILEPPAGADAAARVAPPLEGHGDLHAGNGIASSERDGADLGAGRSFAQARMGSSGPGKGEEGDFRAAMEAHPDVKAYLTPEQIAGIHLSAQVYVANGRRYAQGLAAAR